MQPKSTGKPKAKVPAAEPLKAPRMVTTGKRPQKPGRVTGVRGGRKPYKPAFKKSTTTGKPRTYGIK